MSEHNRPQTSARDKTLGIALALAEADYLVFPCRPFSKAPATENGFHDATVDPEQIRTWFDNDRSLNLAVACGLQPNGINLLAVDIDPKNGGLETWKALTDEHGVPMSPRHETPSGGFHLFFDVPDGTGRTGPHTLGQGIDTRDGSGYVVVPPSRLRDDDGEIITYRASKTAALALNRPHAGPLWLLELLEPPEPLTAAMRRHPSQQPVGVLNLGDSVADKARHDWDWPVELEADGWTLGRRQGDQSQWTRPGKSVREGNSATLHEPDGPFVVYSTSVPMGGVAGRGVRSYSPWDYIVTFRAGGDTKVAAALVRGATPGRAATASPSPQGDDTSQLFPPLDFYDQRPWMAACRQQAQAVGGSPSAHLLAYLCRWATLIPPGYSIPPINGAPSSFDLLSVIAGTSGAGKTSPMRNVARMLPVTREDLRMGLGIGSGEGIIEAFYGIQISEDDKGKAHKERAKTIAGVNFAVSEGLIFAELAGRGGTTHVTRLCDAWSGAALSTANASAETFRHIAEDQYRLTLMMGIQADQAHLLMTDSAASQGFVGRLLFAWAEEPRVSPRPDPPEMIVLPVPPGAVIPAQGGKPRTYLPVFLDYPVGGVRRDPGCIRPACGHQRRRRGPSPRPVAVQSGRNPGADGRAHVRLARRLGDRYGPRRALSRGTTSPLRASSSPCP